MAIPIAIAWPCIATQKSQHSGPGYINHSGPHQKADCQVSGSPSASAHDSISLVPTPAQNKASHIPVYTKIQGCLLTFFPPRMLVPVAVSGRSTRSGKSAGASAAASRTVCKSSRGPPAADRPGCNRSSYPGDQRGSKVTCHRRGDVCFCMRPLFAGAATYPLRALRALPSTGGTTRWKRSGGPICMHSNF